MNFQLRCLGQIQVSLMLGIFSWATPVLAGTVTQSTQAYQVSGASDSQSNITVSSLQPTILQSPNKDDAFAGGYLNGPAGRATLSVHACSGPNGTIFSAGSAGAAVGVQFTNQFQITSSTLPNGTPVFISLVANAARSDRTFYKVDPGFENSTNGVVNFGTATINFGLPTSLYQFPGGFQHQLNHFGDAGTKTGLFNGNSAADIMTLVDGELEEGVIPALVGDYLSVGILAEIHVQSIAARGAVSQVDAQMVLNWGLYPFNNPEIEIVNVTYPGLSVPDNRDITLDTIVNYLPPPAWTVIHGPGVPEPGSVILFGQVVALGLGIRFRRRQVNA